MSDAPWWRDAVCYQIYLRSFADSGTGPDADGIGDLPGVTAHLDHLVDLGVDSLWLNPFYPSPQHDHGYDVADYRDVEPAYGTLGDFDDLVAAAHGRGLKVLVDLVPNHTSSEHAWFREALEAAPGDPARERYIFRDGRGPGGAEPPNNWLSLFGGPAWTRVDDGREAARGSGQWYLHLFDSHQPDLNWHHPDVHADFEQTLRFWLDRGTDGFRVDVAHALYKADGLPDVDQPTAHLDGSAPVSPMWGLEETHDVYRRWHQVLAEYDGDRMLVGEAWRPTPAETARYVRPDEMQQTFNFHWLLATWSAASFREAIETTLVAWDAVGAAATWVLSNHDVVRHPTRYGGGPVGRDRARAATLTQLALPGSSYLYQGEELGLEQVDVPEADRQDPEFVNGRGVGRDGCRVPIPWSGDRPSYGFSEKPGQPWLPQPGDWATSTVAAESESPTSTLSFYRDALATRRTLLTDDWADDRARSIDWLDLGADVVAFTRGPVTVAMNCGEAPVPLPRGEVLVATEPVTDSLPANAAAWIQV